jgi:ArsR family transcriptional regulator
MKMKSTLLITKAISDGNRVRALMALMYKPELCACHIAELLQVTAPTVSRHMNILQISDLVESRKDGRWVYYRLSESGDSIVTSAIEWLSAALETDPPIIKDRKYLDHIEACEVDHACDKK